MRNFATIIVLAIIVERVVEIVKSLIKEGKVNKSVVLSVLIGVGLAFTTRLDLLALLGIEAFIPYVGTTLTGVFLSGGSNYLHDFIEQIGSILGNQ